MKVQYIMSVVGATKKKEIFTHGEDGEKIVKDKDLTPYTY
jgi:hypothetical protein